MKYIMDEYDEALENILKKGIKKSNRTGIDTISVFGMQTRYKIDERFPILTKRKMFYKSIFAELLWMLSGSTNVNDLEKLGSKIWSAWRDKDFEKKNDYDDGELGPIYGWQLRHFGMNYEHREYTKFSEEDWKDNDSWMRNHYDPSRGHVWYKKGDALGFDQISFMMNELKTNKFSRRILFNMWDPSVVTTDKVKLPPCHYTFQLSVDNNDNLSGMLTQRSADYPIGVPANIQFYSALIYMFAQQVDLNPYEFIHSTADSHIYVNQTDSIEEYLARPKKQSPILNLKKASSIFDYQMNDYSIIEYEPESVIKIPVAI